MISFVDHLHFDRPLQHLLIPPCQSLGPSQGHRYAQAAPSYLPSSVKYSDQIKPSKYDFHLPTQLFPIYTVYRPPWW
jgi:hypothetical protein